VLAIVHNLKMAGLSEVVLNKFRRKYNSLSRGFHCGGSKGAIRGCIDFLPVDGDDHARSNRAASLSRKLDRPAITCPV
jgi:hypothetical protein